uniref:non-specific serine/threonine protein kinase n=1 Tax=Setaria digitata TaxID=48799 RepID=A0A915PB72_9BILA
MEAVHKKLLAEWNKEPKALVAVSVALKQIKEMMDNPETLRGLSSAALRTIHRDVYEIDALYAVLQSDLKAFREAISVVMNFYDCYRSNEESPNKFLMIGLNLMYLLTTNQHAQFHMLLEQIDQNIQQNNPYITTPVKLEQSLMEGVYNKVVLTEKNIPSPYYALFIRISMDTVRDEIASCIECSFKKVSQKDAAQLLLFNSVAEIIPFAKKRSWKSLGNTYVFEQGLPEKNSLREGMDDADMDGDEEKLVEELEERSADERIQLKKILKQMERREQEKKRREREKERKHSSMKRTKLPVGVVINTDRNRYKIIEVLGAGGFGDVYKVQQLDGTAKDDELFALKTERITAGKALNRLKVEMTILQECESLPEKKRRHFIKMTDKDSALEIIIFSFSTTIKLGLQTLEAIGNLHDLGYLHRDIKPQNFTIGLKEKACIIYLLDFGIARRYIEKDSKAIRLPRETVRFLGTVRFASRNCHHSREQCRRDDLESWVYMLIEFTEYASLPWSRAVDRDAVCREKERLFAGTYTKHIANLPEEIHKILKYINELNFQNTPDYEYIATMLKRAAARRHASITIKFEWEESEEQAVSSSKAIDGQLRLQMDNNVNLRLAVASMTSSFLTIQKSERSSETDAAGKPNSGFKSKIRNGKLDASKSNQIKRSTERKKKVLEEQES